MKRITLALVASCVVASSQASVLAVWNFNDSNLVVDKDPFALGATLTTNVESGNIMYFSGSTVNADGGDIAGSALAFQAGTGNINNGRNFTISLSTIGWSDLIFTYAIQRTGTGFTSQTVAYSVNGGAYTDFGVVDSIASSFAVKTVDLSGISALDNQANVSLRFTLDGGSASAGNNRMDNMVLTGEAVPEPATMTLLGLGIAAFAARKRRNA